MIGIIQAFLNFLAAMGGTDVRLPSNADIDQYIPTGNDLTMLYDNDLPRLEANLITYLDAVKERWERADALGIRQILGLSKGTQSLMAGQEIKWIDGRYGLRGSKIRLLYNRLSTEQESVVLALSLVTEADATIAIQNMTIDKSTLLESVTELRRLDDLLIRILSAQKAVTLTSCTLAETLALYRTEGNLGAPRSSSSIDLLIPPREEGNIEGSSLNYYNRPHSPNLSSLVYVWESGQFTSEDDARNHALIGWMIHIAGLDIYATPNIAKLSSILWTAHTGGTVSESSRQTVLDALKANFLIETVRRNVTGVLEVTNGFTIGSGEFVRIMPTDPELLISSVLAEATLLLRYVGRPRHLNDTLVDPPGFPANWIAPPRLTYALYNLQVGTPGGSPKEAFVMSALVYAYRTKGSKYKKLRDEIKADATLKAKMKTSIIAAVRNNDEISQAIVDVEFPPIKAWLMNTTKGKKRFELLSHFVETADRRVWKSWDKAGINSYRGNANRYHMLFVYFHLLTGEELPF